MRLALFNEGRLGIVAGDTVTDVSELLSDRPCPFPLTRMHHVIYDYGELASRLQAWKERSPKVPLRDVRLGAPLPNPSKLLAAYANYRRHSLEMARAVGREVQESGPELFLKSPSSIIGPEEKVLLPQVPSPIFHHEAELAVVIGKKTKEISEQDALSCVFGYTAFMDISIRKLPDRTLFRAKSYDTFGPLGPWIVTADEIPDPSNLRIELWVNEEKRQDASPRDMTHSIRTLISFASSVTTLYPGDLIATGTPEGVGPIHPGDRITIAIEKIGEMSVEVS